MFEQAAITPRNEVQHMEANTQWSRPIYLLRDLLSLKANLAQSPFLTDMAERHNLQFFNKKIECPNSTIKFDS
jgi:hypothetical protein